MNRVAAQIGSQQSHRYCVDLEIFITKERLLSTILLYSGVGLAFFSMLTVSVVYLFHRRRPDLPRPFRTPGYPIVPAVYLTGTGLLAAAVFYEQPVVSLISMLSIALARRASLLPPDVHRP